VDGTPPKVLQGCQIPWIYAHLVLKFCVNQTAGNWNCHQKSSAS